MAKDFSSQHVVEGYDQHIRKLIPGYEVVHQQILALLKSYMPEEAHILIVGCGTGYELGYLLQHFPKWHFTATDVSTNMLIKAQAYIEEMNALDRVHFVLGEVDRLENVPSFDAALSILVTHFIGYEQKMDFLKSIQQRLKTNGLFLTFDLTQIKNEKEQQVLKNICEANGLVEAQTKAMLKRLKDDFYPLSPSKTKQQLQQAGFSQISSFTQMLCYWGFLAFAT